jgi:hypothetical protein
MKKLIIILCVLSTNLVFSQNVALKDVDSVVNDIRLEAGKINSQVLYKAVLWHDGYIEPAYNGSYEWLFELYFDVENKLRKTISRYRLEDDKSCMIYYDTAGVAIYTSYFAWGMTGLYSTERYLDKYGKLLYVNHISKADDYHTLSSADLIADEIIIRKGYYEIDRWVVPSVHDAFYDSVLFVSDFQNQFLQGFDPEGWRYEGIFPMPPKEKKYPVRFNMPKKGDTTSLTQNSVSVYVKPASESLILFTLNIRRDIKIIDIKKDWYKVSVPTIGGDTVMGYILGAFLEPVEKIIE